MLSFITTVKANSVEGLLEKLKQSNSDSVKAEIYLSIADELEYTQVDSSIYYGLKAIESANKNGYYGLIAKSEINVAYKYIFKGDFNGSIPHFQATVQLGKDEKDSILISSGYAGIGNCYFHQQEFASALEYFLLAYKVDLSIGDSTFIAADLNNIGNVYYQLEALENASTNYENALEMYRLVQNEKGQSTTLTNLANVYSDQQLYRKAISLLNKALAIDRDRNDLENEASVLNNLGAIYQELNQSDSATYYYHNAITIRTQLEDKEGIISTQLNLFALLLKSSSDKVEVEALKEMYDSAKAYRFTKHIVQATDLLQQVYHVNRQPDSAYKYLGEFVKWSDSLQNQEKIKAVASLQAKHELEMLQMMKQQQASEQIRVKLEKEARRDRLQYSGILIVISFLFLLIFFIGRVKLTEGMANGLIFFSFIVFFEFILVLTDPFVDKYSMGQPIIKLGANTFFALIIIPLHNYFEKRLRKRVVKKNEEL